RRARCEPGPRARGGGAAPPSLTGRGLLLHRQLRLQAQTVAEQARQREELSAREIADAGVVFLQAALDDGLVVPGSVADVVERDVVVLAPEERDVPERSADARQRARQRLPLPLGQHPVLDARERSTARLRPARAVADRVDASGRRLQ